MKTNEPRFCVLCRHFVRSAVGNEFGKCGRVAPAVNPIDGSCVPRFCSVEREPTLSDNDPRCGPEGRYFENAMDSIYVPPVPDNSENFAKLAEESDPAIHP